MRDGGSDFILQLVPIFLWSCGFGVVAYKLAKEKGRNVTLWTIVALIPLLNLMALPFFVGAANRNLERKLDELVKR